MTVSKLSSILLIAGLLSAPTLASAQNPTTAQAQQMLQSNPALLQQLRQKILTSGLTPDQVRARLRAEGYPENLLDAYLPGGNATPDNASSPEEVFSAIAKLGIADTTEVDLLRCGISADSLAIPDTLPNGMIDSTQTAKARNDQRNTLQKRCLAQEDSLMRGLKNNRADSGFV